VYFATALQGFSALHAQFGGMVDVWLLVFCRLLAFINFAPILGRKDIIFPAKLGIAIYLTCILIWTVPHPAFGQGSSQGWPGAGFVLLIILNVVIGALIGFVADLIMQAVSSAGDLMNNQIGLSSAMMFDPASRKQTALIETLLTFIALIIFLQLGGIHWLVFAIQRSFTVFPMASLAQSIPSTLSLEYLISLSSNMFLVGTTLIAPVMAVTMGVDLILGIMNRTSQQIPVFQLSMGLKPTIGVLVMLATLPIFINAIKDFLQDHQGIF
jgi:flagellar biosynthesis protein FliR